MPPKKKSGGKKKAAAKKPVVVKDTDLSLPPIPTTKTTSLLHAVSTSTPTTVSRLVGLYNYGATLNTVDMNNSTPIHIAAKRGDALMLERILSFKELDVKKFLNACEAPAVGGYAAIHHVCALGHVDALQVLLKHGAQINLKTQSALGDTALHIVCKTGPVSISCGKLLIESKADVNALDNFGHNATYWATSKGHLDMCRELNLPSSHAATPNEFIRMMMARPGFSLPKEKSKAKKDAKGKKK